jgi:hypothetical protein
MTTIKIRRDTAANWQANNPVLAEGEFGYETDTGRLKIGDGTTAWNSLPYLVGERVPEGFDFNDVTDKVSVDDTTITKNASGQLEIKDATDKVQIDNNSIIKNASNQLSVSQDFVDEAAIVYALIF